jgi:hypothetical protein
MRSRDFVHDQAATNEFAPTELEVSKSAILKRGGAEQHDFSVVRLGVISFHKEISELPEPGRVIVSVTIRQAMPGLCYSRSPLCRDRPDSIHRIL